MSGAILRRVLPEEDREAAEGELLEAFRRRAGEIGARAAARWYRRQVWGFVWRAVPVRAFTRRRRMRGMRWTEAVMVDLRWAVRGLGKRPGFTVVAVATLALGIGSNSAIFTLASAHFFEALPYERPDELALVWETQRHGTDITTVAPGNYFAWRELATSFVAMAAYNVDQAAIGGGDGPAERVNASVVAPSFFDVLGARPAVGSTFSEAGVRAADGRQVVIGHALWTRRFGRDPAVVGRTVRVDGDAYAIVGVMPAGFRQPERELTWQATELWRPMLLDGQRDDFASRYLRVVARRRADVSVERAREEMRLLAARLEEAHPEGNTGRSVVVRTLDEHLLETARPTLLVLLAAGAAVLAIVCANLANLTLARGEERRREFALRAALGSGGVRLLRQVLLEGVVLALAGAAVGAVAVRGARGLLQSVQARFFSGLIDVSVDGRVIGFTVLLAVGTGVAFGLPLARIAARAEVRSALVESGGRTSSGLRAERARRLLVVGQLALATTLLVTASLLIRSFDALVSVPPGFDPSGVVTFTVAPPRSDYPDAESVAGYHRALRAEVEQVPGVRRVGMASDLMFTTENTYTTLLIDGRPAPDDPPTAEFHVVVPEYFEVLGIPLVSGALPDDGLVDRPALEGAEEAEIPAAVNQAMARRHWPDGDALGAGFLAGGARPRRYRVVATVGDVLDDGYDARAEPAFFIPFAASPRARMSYVVRADGDAAALTAELRAAVASVDPGVPASDLAPLESLMAETAARPRAASLIGATFALLALLVAAAGIFGVLSYAVQARTREIGIRAALGASDSRILSMVMGQSARLVVAGLVLGAGGALLSGRLVSGLLFGVRPWDPPSLAVAAVLLGVVALAAAWIPARRAVAVDPIEALRSE